MAPRQGIGERGEKVSFISIRSIFSESKLFEHGSFFIRPFPESECSFFQSLRVGLCVNGWTNGRDSTSWPRGCQAGKIRFHLCYFQVPLFRSRGSIRPSVSSGLLMFGSFNFSDDKQHPTERVQQRGAGGKISCQG